MAGPRLVFQPHTYDSLLAGARQVVAALRPTLGPRPRFVAVTKTTDGRTPEVLDSGGIIARRITQLADPDQDMGAMLVRQMLWRLHEEVGDGTATAAVLFQAIFEDSVRHVAAGHNAMLLRNALEEVLDSVLAALDGMIRPVDSRDELAALARSVCHDAVLAEALADVFAWIGAYGPLDLRSGYGRDVQIERLDGVYWPESGLLSRKGDERADLSVACDAAAVLITDLDLDEPQDLAPAARAALMLKARALVVVTRNVSEKVLAFLLTNSQPDRFRVIAVKTPGAHAKDQIEAVQDLAAATGGCCLLSAAGDTWAGVTTAHYGRLQAVWADRFNFGLTGDLDDAAGLGDHLDTLRRTMDRVTSPEARRVLEARFGRLLGKSAVLWIGGVADSEIRWRLAAAEHAANAVRRALAGGVLPGAGAALMACSRVLKTQAASCTDEIARVACRILSHALAEPMRVIATNGGYDAGRAMAAVSQQQTDYAGFDVESGGAVDVVAAGILDVAAAQKAAVSSAVRTAALALTVDTLVHRKTVPIAVAP